jgi:hypothetical protein
MIMLHIVHGKTFRKLIPLPSTDALVVIILAVNTQVMSVRFLNVWYSIQTTATITIPVRKCISYCCNVDRVRAGESLSAAPKDLKLRRPPS